MKTMLQFVLFSSLLCSAGDFSLSRNIDDTLEKINTQQSINEADLSLINDYLGTRDSWAISSTNGKRILEPASDLVNITNSFSRVDGNLTSGIYWNDSSYPVLLDLDSEDAFVLPANGIILVDMFHERINQNRPVMLTGGARNGLELQDLMSSNPETVHIIRSSADWIDYMNSPSFDFFGGNQELLNKFTENLVFRNGGIAGLWLGDLEDRMGQEAFDNLMRLFGLSSEYGRRPVGDRDDMECEKRATCAPKDYYICTSNC